MPSSPPTLTIRIKKVPDGPPVLTAVRADGSSTWQRSNAAFPVHDLVHYSVESALGFRNAFLGLLAQGWELTDFGRPWPRGALPEEAVFAEAIVGEVWRCFLLREPLTAAELNERVAAHRKEHGLPLLRTVTEGELSTAVARLGELAMRWRSLPVGGTLELPFPPG